MKLIEMKLELKKLQGQIDEIRLDDKGEERQDLTSEDYDKVNKLLDQQDELVKMIETQERMERNADRLSEPTTQPVTNDAQPDNETHGFPTFGDYIQAVIMAGTPKGERVVKNSLGEEIRSGYLDPRLREERAASGMSESLPQDGGYLVQTDYANELITKAHQTGILASKCRKVTMSARSNSMKLYGVDETSRVAGSRWGGIQAYWQEEASLKTKSHPKFRVINLTLNKLVGLVYLTDELIEDTVGLAGWVSGGFAEEFGFQIDDAIINGTGVGRPMGILNSNCLVSVSKETGQPATTLRAENIEKMYSRMYGPSMRNANWYINQDVWPQIFQLHHAVGTGGVPMFIPAGGINQTPNGTLLGRPIQPIEQCQTLGTKGDIYFADFSQYIFADKGGMQSASSIHVRFIYDELVLRFVYRCDGQPIWSAALTPYKGSNTQSPFIALNART